MEAASSPVLTNVHFNRPEVVAPAFSQPVLNRRAKSSVRPLSTVGRRRLISHFHSHPLRSPSNYFPKFRAKLFIAVMRLSDNPSVSRPPMPDEADRARQ